VLGDTLSDADDEGDLGVQGLLDTGGSQRGTGGLAGAEAVGVSWMCSRDEEGSGGGASLLDGVRDVGEDGETEVLLASLLGIRATDDLGACRGEKSVLVQTNSSSLSKELWM
jgi:hypothetical protein